MAVISMKKHIRNYLRVVLVAVFFISTTMLVSRYVDKATGSNAYEEAAAIASANIDSNIRIPEAAVPAAPRPDMQWIPAPVEQDPHVDELLQIDLAALREVNPDVVGWILIPDTEINYPLMQGQDNDYYLNRTWKGHKNSVGSIFIEHQNNGDLMDDNTLIYGHNMRDGSMFADLRNYSVTDYWKSNPFIYIITDGGVYRYDVIGGYSADLEGLTFGLEYEGEGSMQNFLNYIRKMSEFDTGIQPDVHDRIITLTTCYGNTNETRWVVHGRLRMMEVEVQ